MSIPLIPKFSEYYIGASSERIGVGGQKGYSRPAISTIFDLEVKTGAQLLDAETWNCSLVTPSVFLL